MAHADSVAWGSGRVVPPTWDHEVDVVVLGTGAAGMTAALAAAANGASVAIYEKAPTVGGTTAVSGGIVWTPAH
ncbi:MAG TPA: FAD-dependent oxidoreductase, partial [Mycobacterium sp.]|nr:FAD-dependent oxidoreductase [Mycobacterium sp.]